VLEPHLGELDRAQVLYVGDHLGDMQAAHGAGLKFVAVLTGYFSRQAFMENGLSEQYIINDVAQLPAWLMAEKEIEP